MTQQLASAITQYVQHLQTLTVKTVQFDAGRKYGKITFHGALHNSVHSFIDLTTGDVFKPASWKGPVKGARFNLLTNFEQIMQVADPYGSYLYLNRA